MEANGRDETASLVLLLRRDVWRYVPYDACKNPIFVAMFPPELATKPLQCAFWRESAKPAIRYATVMRGKGPAGIMSAYATAWESPPKERPVSD